MRHAAALSLIAAIAAFTLASDVQAQQGKGKPEQAEVRTQQVVGFSASERQIIVEFFRTNPYETHALPPGIAKNLARGKPLPPGIAKTRIPSGLQARLPARAGVEVSIFGDRIVLLEASGLVVDVLEGIFG